MAERRSPLRNYFIPSEGTYYDPEPNTPPPTAGEMFNLVVSPDADFRRGLRTTNQGLYAGDLFRQADQYEVDTNDRAGAEKIREQARRVEEDAAQTRQRVGSFQDVQGVGDAVDFLQGGFGTLLPTMGPPMAGGAAGSAAGAAIGSLIAPGIGTAAGAYIGGALGAAVPAFQMEAGEQASSQQADPYIRENTTAEQRLHEQNVKGFQNAALESIFPAVFGGRIVTGSARRIAGEALKRSPLRRTLTVAKEGAIESGTEFTQTLTGQASLSRLNPNRDTTHDYIEQIDSIILGALGGTSISLGSVVPGYAAEKLGSKVERSADVALNDLGRAVAAEIQLRDIGPQQGIDVPLRRSEMFDDEATKAQWSELARRWQQAQTAGDPELEQRVLDEAIDFKLRQHPGWQPVEEGISSRTAINTGEGSNTLRLNPEGAPTQENPDINLLPDQPVAMFPESAEGAAKFTRQHVRKGEERRQLMQWKRQGFIPEEGIDAAQPTPLGQWLQNRRAAPEEVQAEVDSMIRDIDRRLRSAKEGQTQQLQAEKEALQNAKTYGDYYKALDNYTVLEFPAEVVQGRFTPQDAAQQQRSSELMTSKQERDQLNDEQGIRLQLKIGGQPRWVYRDDVIKHARNFFRNELSSFQDGQERDEAALLMGVFADPRVKTVSIRNENGTYTRITQENANLEDPRHRAALKLPPLERDKRRFKTYDPANSIESPETGPYVSYGEYTDEQGRRRSSAAVFDERSPQASAEDLYERRDEIEEMEMQRRRAEERLAEAVPNSPQARQAQAQLRRLNGLLARNFDEFGGAVRDQTRIPVTEENPIIEPAPRVPRGTPSLTPRRPKAPPVRGETQIERVAPPKTPPTLGQVMQSKGIAKLAKAAGMRDYRMFALQIIALREGKIKDSSNIREKDEAYIKAGVDEDLLDLFVAAVAGKIPLEFLDTLELDTGVASLDAQRTAKQFAGDFLSGKIAANDENIAPVRKSTGTQPQRTAKQARTRAQKTASGNVVVKNGVPAAKAYANADPQNRVYTLRQYGAAHYGNPFTHLPIDKTQGTVLQVGSVAEAVQAYRDWLTTTKYDGKFGKLLDARKKWILEQLPKLKGKELVYYKELGEPSHANVLDELVQAAETPKAAPEAVTTQPETSEAAASVPQSSTKPYVGQKFAITWTINGETLRRSGEKYEITQVTKHDKYWTISFKDTKTGKEYKYHHVGPDGRGGDLIADAEGNIIPSDANSTYHIFEGAPVAQRSKAPAPPPVQSAPTMRNASRETSEAWREGLPEHTIDRNLKNPDGSKLLASTNLKTGKIRINPVETVKEFFDYFEGKANSPTSRQKKVVLNRLANSGWTRDKIRNLITTPGLANRFLVLHEADHVANREADQEIYRRNSNMMSPGKIAVETRASKAALDQLEASGVKASKQFDETPGSVFYGQLAKNLREKGFRIQQDPDTGEVMVVDKDGNRLEQESDDLKKSMQMDAEEVAAISTREDAEKWLVRAFGAEMRDPNKLGWMRGQDMNFAAGDYNGLTDFMRLALNSHDPLSFAFHEGMHKFVKKLKETNPALYERMVKAATAPHIVKQMEKLLYDLPSGFRAIDQLRLGMNSEDPAIVATAQEEHVAYAFQLYAASRADHGPKFNIQPSLKQIFRKIMESIARVLGVMTHARATEKIFDALYEGRINRDGIGSLQKYNERTVKEYAKDMTNLIKSAVPRILSSPIIQLQKQRNANGEQIQAFVKLAKALHSEPLKGGPSGYIYRSYQADGQYQNRWRKILTDNNVTEEDMRSALKNFQSMREPRNQFERDLKHFLAQMYVYQFEGAPETNPTKVLKVVDEETGLKDWVKPDRVENYWPRVWSIEEILANEIEFREVMREEGNLEEDTITNFIQMLQATNGTEVGSELQQYRAEFSPYNKAINARVFEFINEGNAHKFAKFQEQNMAKVMERYIRQATHRREHSRTFKHDGSGIRDLLFEAQADGATPEQIAYAEKVVKGVEGRLGTDQVSDLARETMVTSMSITNFAILAMATLSSMVDPLGVLVRTGSMKAAGNTFKQGFAQIIRDARKVKTSDQELTEYLGIIVEDMVQDMLNNMERGVYMNEKLRTLNRWYFKSIGLEQWTRGTRIGAMRASLEYLKKYQNDAARLEEVGLEVGDIQEFGDRIKVKPGEFRTGEEITAANIEQARRVQNAIFRMVDESVLRPSAGTRPLWSSDMRFRLLGHLKSYIFTFHNQILRQVYTRIQKAENPAQAARALLPLLSYVPVMLAADMVRDMLKGDDKDRDWDELLGRALQRSAILGMGTFLMDIEDDMNWGNIPTNTVLGPVIDNALNLGRTAVNPDASFLNAGAKLLPYNALWRNWGEE